MRKPGGLWHWLGLAVLVLLLVLPSSASATTSIRVFPAAPYRDVRVSPLAAPPVTTGANVVRHFAAAPGYAAAGVQGTSPGLEGTTVVLPSCAAACTDRYRPASSVAIAAGHYTDRVTFTVTQPAAAGPAVGFDIDIAVHLTTGWVVGHGYFSTGVATRATTSTITLRMYVDLGTAAPTVIAVEVTVNRCLSTTACP
jgi:hypothetical protein